MYKVRFFCPECGGYQYLEQEILNDSVNCPIHPSAIIRDFIVIDKIDCKIYNQCSEPTLTETQKSIIWEDTTLINEITGTEIYTASSSDPLYLPANATDGDVNTKWQSALPGMPNVEWIVQFPSAKTITRVDVHPTHGDPDLQILAVRGSNNNIDWDDLGVVGGSVVANDWNIINLSTPGSYLYYKIDIVCMPNIVGINEVKMYEDSLLQTYLVYKKSDGSQIREPLGAADVNKVTFNCPAITVGNGETVQIYRFTTTENAKIKIWSAGLSALAGGQLANSYIQIYNETDGQVEYQTNDRFVSGNPISELSLSQKDISIRATNGTGVAVDLHAFITLTME